MNKEDLIKKYWENPEPTLKSEFIKDLESLLPPPAAGLPTEPTEDEMLKMIPYDKFKEFDSWFIYKRGMECIVDWLRSRLNEGGGEKKECKHEYVTGVFKEPTKCRLCGKTWGA